MVWQNRLIKRDMKLRSASTNLLCFRQSLLLPLIITAYFTAFFHLLLNMTDPRHRLRLNFWLKTGRETPHCLGPSSSSRPTIRLPFSKWNGTLIEEEEGVLSASDTHTIRPPDYRKDRHAILILSYRDQADSRCVWRLIFITVGRLWANIEPRFYCWLWVVIIWWIAARQLPSISGFLEVLSNPLNSKWLFGVNSQKIVSWEVMRVFNANRIASIDIAAPRTSPKDDVIRNSSKVFWRFPFYLFIIFTNANFEQKKLQAFRPSRIYRFQRCSNGPDTLVISYLASPASSKLLKQFPWNKRILSGQRIR